MSSNEWVEDAACAGTDPEAFYIEVSARGSRLLRAQQGQALAVCNGDPSKDRRPCPVRLACLDAAMAEEGDVLGGSRWGIRGGLTADQRADLANRKRVTA